MFDIVGVAYAAECEVQQFPSIAVFLIDFGRCKFGSYITTPHICLKGNTVPKYGSISKHFYKHIVHVSFLVPDASGFNDLEFLYLTPGAAHVDKSGIVMKKRSKLVHIFIGHPLPERQDLLAKVYHVVMVANPIEHPLIGSHIIGHFDMWSKEQRVIRAHHERWDGKGYPEGLNREEIPYLARIIAVADVYDALTSDRSYRSKMSLEKALAILKENSGSQFDPEILDLFVDLVHRGNLDCSGVPLETGARGEAPAECVPAP